MSAVMQLEEVLSFIPQGAIFTFIENDEEMQLYRHSEDGWCVCKVSDPAIDPATDTHTPDYRVEERFVEAMITNLYNSERLDRILTYNAEGKCTAYTPFIVSQRLACSAGLLPDNTFKAEFWDGEVVIVPYEVAARRPFRIGFPRS